MDRQPAETRLPSNATQTRHSVRFGSCCPPDPPQLSERTGPQTISAAPKPVLSMTDLLVLPTALFFDNPTPFHVLGMVRILHYMAGAEQSSCKICKGIWSTIRSCYTRFLKFLWMACLDHAWLILFLETHPPVLPTQKNQGRGVCKTCVSLLLDERPCGIDLQTMPTTQDRCYLKKYRNTQFQLIQRHKQSQVS